MRHGSTRLLAPVVMLWIDMVAIAGLGETADANRKEILPDVAKVETSPPQADANAVKSLWEEIHKRSGHEPPADLIPVESPGSRLFLGAVILFGGVVLLAFAPIAPMWRLENPRLARVGMGAAGGIIAVAGVCLFVTGYQQRERLAREGRTAQAVVTAQWGSSSPWVKHPGYIAYRFVAQFPDGSTRTVACRGSMGYEKLYRKLEIGDEFTVRYLPSDLRIGEPMMGSHTTKPWHLPRTEQRDLKPTPR
jgi:hypothetical protein